MRNTIAVAVAAALAGCAAPKAVEDTTPENPTAVFETKVSSSGIAGNFPFESTQKRYVRADMSRDDHNMKGTGTFSGFLVTKMAGGPGDTHIARLDRKLLWTVNDKRKEYVECPISGCPLPAGADKPQKPEAQPEQQPKQKAEEGCTMRIASSQFNVKPSGQKKEVNGFNADQYQGAWIVRFQDNKKRTSTSTVNLDIWTSPVTADMKKALDTESAFGRAYLASVSRPQMPIGKPGEHAAVPPEVFTMMSSYLGNLSPADRAAFQRAMGELQKIKGQPVSTKLEWFLEGNACGSDKEQQPQQQSSSPKSASDALMSGAMSLFKKDEKPAGPQPVLSFTVEVKQLGVVPVRDSIFQVPAAYKKVN
jgi:hypothetical protein